MTHKQHSSHCFLLFHSYALTAPSQLPTQHANAASPLGTPAKLPAISAGVACWLWQQRQEAQPCASGFLPRQPCQPAVTEPSQQAAVAARCRCSALNVALCDLEWQPCLQHALECTEQQGQHLCSGFSVLLPEPGDDRDVPLRPACCPGLTRIHLCMQGMPQGLRGHTTATSSGARYAGRCSCTRCPRCDAETGQQSERQPVAGRCMPHLCSEAQGAQRLLVRCRLWADVAHHQRLAAASQARLQC